MQLRLALTHPIGSGHGNHGWIALPFYFGKTVYPMGVALQFLPGPPLRSCFAHCVVAGWRRFLSIQQGGEGGRKRLLPTCPVVASVENMHGDGAVVDCIQFFVQRPQVVAYNRHLALFAAVSYVKECCPGAGNRIGIGADGREANVVGEQFPGLCRIERQAVISAIRAAVK